MCVCGRRKRKKKCGCCARVFCVNVFISYFHAVNCLVCVQNAEVNFPPWFVSSFFPPLFLFFFLFVLLTRQLGNSDEINVTLNKKKKKNPIANEHFLKFQRRQIWIYFVSPPPPSPLALPGVKNNHFLCSSVRLQDFTCRFVSPLFFCQIEFEICSFNPRLSLTCAYVAFFFSFWKEGK